MASRKAIVRFLQTEPMLRYLLAIYMLMLAITDAAPCCCTVARASQALTSLVEAKTSQAPSVPSCCHSQKQHCSETSAPEAPVPQRCQCEKSSCQAVVPEQTVIPADFSHQSLFNNFAVLSSPMTIDVLANAFSLFPDGPPEPVGQSGRDVRVALCSWRC